MVYFNTAELLKEAGHDVVFFSKRYKENIPCEQEPYFVDNSVGIAQIRSYFFNEKAANQLEKLLDIEKPDIAHVHLIWGGLSPSILKVLKRNHVPVVHTAHDYRMVCPAYLLKDGKGRFCERCKGKRFYECAFHRCSKGSFFESTIMTMEMYYRNRNHHPVNNIDGFIFVSEFSKRKHIEFDECFKSAKTTVLYNCPGEEVQKSLNTEEDTFDNEFLFYGRLSKEKGIHTLIYAFEKYPQLGLNIVGTGPIEEELKTYCREKKLINIHFLGYKTGKDLFDLVANAKYVCVPSECYENNPMTIVEAYSLGTPVIGAAIGGISEVVKDSVTGFTFKSGSVESLSEALNKASTLNRDEYIEQKRESHRFGEEHFSRKRHLGQLLSFYNEVIKNGNY